MGLSDNLNMISNEQFQQLLEYKERQENALKAISESEKLNFNRVFKINSWKDVQNIVRRGEARKYFKIGDQFQSYHSVYGTGTEKLLTWDILGIDYDRPVDSSGNYLTTTDSQGNIIPMHSLTLQTHDCISTTYKWHRSDVNNWQNSDSRNWLNTTEVVDGYNENRGFLYGFDPDLLEVIGYVAKTTTRNNSESGKAIVLTEKLFLPSTTEIFAGANNGYNEGAIFLSEDETPNGSKFYCTKDENNIITKVAPASGDNPKQSGWYEVSSYYEYYGPLHSDLPNPSTGSDTNRKKKIGTGNYDRYWTRSPVTGSNNSVYAVDSTGIVGIWGATSKSYCIAPACVIC